MKLTALGHACFLAENGAGVRVMFDPFDDSIGYPSPKVEAAVVCSGHGHHDHNAFDAPLGNFVPVTRLGEQTVCGVKLTGIPCFHDEQQGALRGENRIYKLETDGLTLVHMSDIGHQLSGDILDQIRGADVLMIPVGGVFTVDAAGAKRICDAVRPRIIVPMHYQTKTLTLGKTLGTLEAFTGLFGQGQVQLLKDNSFTFTAGDGLSGVVVPKV